MANLRPESKQPVDKSENIAVPAGHQEQIYGVSGTVLRGIGNICSGYQERPLSASH